MIIVVRIVFIIFFTWVIILNIRRIRAEKLTNIIFFVLIIIGYNFSRVWAFNLLIHHMVKLDLLFVFQCLNSSLVRMSSHSRNRNMMD